jgi:hypothetical protein
VWGLYKTQPGFALGFHGCDEELGRAVIAGEHHLEPSSNSYDWLGTGVYFWEGSPQRAEEWAINVHKRHPSRVRRPFVVGAIIDLGNCFNLVDRSAVTELAEAHETFKLVQEAAGLEMPRNEGGTQDRLLRYLDRAVIEWMHQVRAGKRLADQAPAPPYDTLRSPFLEGPPLFEGAGIRSMTHIQIAVRNMASIKGYFLPIRSS